MANHALLSASSSHRWIACPPSAQLNAKAPDKPSEYAQEGTDAHELCQYKVEDYLGMDVKNPVENLTYYNAEMENCADSYRDYVAESIEGAKAYCKDPLVMVEKRVDFTQYVPEGFGTCDCLIAADNTLHIIDFKYGVGVLVEAKNNPQMMLYALGALSIFDGIYDIENISMTIFQPRREHISTANITKDALITWAEGVLKPAATAAMKGIGEFYAGDHCRFCKVKATCRKRAEYNMAMAKYDFAMPNTLEDEEISIILSRAEDLTSWVADVKEYALQKALDGHQWEGYKLVEGHATRKYTDEKAIGDKVTEAGFDPYEKKLLGITALTKLLGKSKFEEIVGPYTAKPSGKPTLVKDTDKRPQIELKLTASEDFKEEN